MKIILFILLAITGIGAGIAYGDGIDPGVLVRKTGEYGVDESKNNEPRPGVDVDEINLQSVSSTVTVDIANKMNSSGPVAVGGGLYNGNWVSLTNLFTTVGISDQSTIDAFNKWFNNVDAKKDNEVYWGDVNNNNNIENTEWYHRFNLARTDWDTMTIGGAAPNLFAAPVAYSDPPPSIHNGGGLRWLANFGKNASGADDQNLRGTFPYDAANPLTTGVAARRNQIAANLIDYCDTNSTATTDSSTNPTYTGNEHTPYINEIGVKIECTATVSKSGNTYKNNYTFTPTVYCEVINVYNGFNLDSTTTFEILEGTVTYTWQSNSTAGGTTPVTSSIACGPSTFSTPVGTGNYMTYSFSAPSINGIGDTAFSNNKKNAVVTNVKVQIKRARLTYGGVFADFAQPDSSADFSKPVPTLVTRNGNSQGFTTASACFSYQVNDPRQNLNRDDWNHPAEASKPGTPAVYGTTKNPANFVVGTLNTANAVNGASIVTFATDGDMESTLTPTTLSTAYIRNAPMASPWELGAIHRGAKWETINLKEYNAVAGSKPLTGGGLYKESSLGSKNGGDANILDQVKMTSKVENKQKVNLNLRNDDTTGTISYGVLSALFREIRVGSLYANTVKLCKSAANTGAFDDIGDRWIDNIGIGVGTLYTWDGSSWVDTAKSVGDSYIYNASNAINIYNGTAWVPWSNTGTAISNPDVKAIVVDIKTRVSTPSTAFKTRAGVVAQNSTLINRTEQVALATDRAKEEIIGKTINLTTVAPSGYFTIFIIAQSIKDVGPGTFSKDLDMNGIISNPPPLGSPGEGASEVILGTDINGDGDMTDTGIAETITKTAFGSYKQYADEITAEQKIRADVYRNPQTGKYTIIRMEYLED
ncbi:MAG: hypothetical protein WC637_14220 [Victivallales bacterium]|jgi:hypothetical protein